MPEIVMPRLSDSMEEGTVLRWLKRVGEEVALGEELVEIETDKANMAYESDVAGTLTGILAPEGETLPVGAPIAVVGAPDGEGPAPAAADDEGRAPAAAAGEEGRAPAAAGEQGPAPRAAGPVAPTAPAAPGGPAAPARRGAPASAPAAGGGRRASGAGGGDGGASGHAAGSGRPKASPLARRLVWDTGVDLATVTGSGPGGRIVKADVEAASAAGAPTGAPRRAQAEPGTVGAVGARGPAAAGEGPAPSHETARGTVEVVELTRLQQVVARRMAESNATAPHFYLRAEIDMSAAVEARGRLKAAAPEGEAAPSLNDMVVRACALALREHPLANGSYVDGRLELHSRVNVGVAVAAPDALVVPTIFDADRKGLREIAAEARRLAGRVREGSVTPPELSGGTFTVSNLGMYGVTGFSAVINPPQAAILAVGAVVERPVVRDGSLGTAHLLGVTLACDHRILYGAPAAGFLARVRALLEEPLGLAL